MHDDRKLRFFELKAKRSFRFVVFKIEDKIQQVAVEKLGQTGESYEDFTASLPADAGRYAVFYYDFTTNENSQKSKARFSSSHGNLKNHIRGFEHPQQT